VWVCSALTDSLRNCSKSCIRTLMLFLTCLIFLSSETQKMICFGPYNESQLGADVVGQCGLSVYGPKWLFKWQTFHSNRLQKQKHPHRCQSSFLDKRIVIERTSVLVLVNNPDWGREMEGLKGNQAPDGSGTAELSAVLL